MKTKSEWYIQDASTIHAAAQLSRCSPFKSIWKSITKHTDTERDKWRDRESQWGRGRETVQRWEVWVLSKNYGFAASASVAIAVAFEFEIRILTHAKR